MFRLCKTAIIIWLRISEVHKEGSHVAVTIHSIIKLTGEISSLLKIFVEIPFWKRFMYFCNTKPDDGCNFVDLLNKVLCVD
jgi:hypothetical protein